MIEYIIAIFAPVFIGSLFVFLLNQETERNLGVIHWTIKLFFSLGFCMTLFGACNVLSGGSLQDPMVGSLMQVINHFY